jgi:FMN phosphatase YigB (HAD superfamily)
MKSQGETVIVDIFIDIGFTLMGGPALSPPKKIREVLGLGEDALARLSGMVFTEDHREPGSLIESVEKAFGIRATDVQRDEIAWFWSDQYTAPYELDGATGMIDRLHELGHTLHIVSNLWFPFYEKFRDAFRDQLGYFATETLSFEEGVKKPSGKFYESALKRSGADPKVSLMIGDSVDNDIGPAARLGMSCIWYISRPFDDAKLDGMRAELKGYDNIYEVGSLNEATRIAERMTKSG